VLQPSSVSVLVGHFSAPAASGGEKRDIMAPSRVLRATIFLEEKNYKKTSELWDSGNSVFVFKWGHCGIERGPLEGQRESSALHILFHFSLFILVYLLFSFFSLPC